MVRMECSSRLDMYCTVASEQTVLWGIGLRGQEEDGAKGQGERLLHPLPRFPLFTNEGKLTDIAVLCNKVKLTIIT